jgi:hypothetical protein
MIADFQNKATGHWISIFKGSSKGLTADQRWFVVSVAAFIDSRNRHPRRLATTRLYSNENKALKEFRSLPRKCGSEMGCTPRLEIHDPSPWDGPYTDFGCIHSHDLPAPRRNALSHPKVWPVSGG